MARGLQNYKIGFQPFSTSFSDLSLCKRYNRECLFSVTNIVTGIVHSYWNSVKFLYAYYMYPRSPCQELLFPYQTKKHKPIYPTKTEKLYLPSCLFVGFPVPGSSQVPLITRNSIAFSTPNRTEITDFDPCDVSIESDDESFV